MYNLSLEDEASLREKMLSSAFHPIFFFLSFPPKKENFVITRGAAKRQTPFLSRKGKFTSALNSPSTKGVKILVSYPERSSSRPLSERIEIIQNFLAVKPNSGRGGLIHGVRETEHPYFSVKYHRDQVLMLRAGHGPEDIKFARTVSDEGSAARGTTSNIRKRALVKAERRCYRNRSILASPRATIPWCRMPPGIPRGKLR